MSNATTVACALLALTATAAAQIDSGNLVLTYPTSGASNLEWYAADGTVGGSVAGPDSSWISSAQMPDGRLVIHNNSGSIELVFYSTDGTLLSSFPVAVNFYSSDIGVFADGIIAICSRGEGLLLYNDLGVYQGAINVAGMESAMGLHIAGDDTVWIADLATWPGNTDGKIWHLDRGGNVLHSFDTAFDASDVDLAPDGSVWVCGYQGEIAHYTVDGTLIHQFDAIISHTLRTTWSLAVGDDGVIWVSGHYDSFVRSYNSSGVMLSEFDTVAPGNSTFTFITGGNSWSTPYCYGDGSGNSCPCGNTGGPEEGCDNSTGVGATLLAAGTNSVAGDNLLFTGEGLISNQSVLLFSANNAVNGGSGNLFGDGLRCAGGSLVRLGVETADGSGVAHWGPGLGVKGGWVAGDTRYFQAWYRDPGSSPCGSEFNLSHGVEVVFVP